jgi:hypothetical protein
MSTKDLEQVKLAATVARLEKVVSALLIRVATLEKETKRLRGSVGRATDQVGYLDRRTQGK